MADFCGFLFVGRRASNHVQFEEPPHDHLEAQLYMEPVAISVNSAAKALGIGRSSIYALIKGGQLEAIKIGRRTLLTTASIKRLVQAAPMH
ncbi:helix-turn-helix domain-containing protein [Acidocella aromatica]|uniref:Excisionase family DNA binding protein n=1 Tax=Acidocella aromatica TaxID=1303579 RepID=A0A840VKU3_9PROT|nr:helix-turn-helix domain-containing protein [Acidocella aromatica]MBB5373785.1 excisionase family DNA binding protein [Acidocella aromatica]